MRNGLLITATAHINNGKIEKIVYEEYDSSRNITATTLTLRNNFTKKKNYGIFFKYGSNTKN